MNILKRIFTKKQKAVIKSIKHAIYRFIHLQGKIETTLIYRVIKQRKSDVFFGYYDISPFNSIDKILYIKKEKNSDEVKICINDSNDLSQESILAVSKAWNWQQGCRLRWFPGYDDRVIFNFFEENKYGSRIIDTEGNIIKNYQFPIYDISHDGQLGITLNFDRLGLLRPGYGYTCIPYNANNLYNESIRIIDLATGIIKDKITYQMIAKAIKYKRDYDKCYINHLSFSPDGKSFLFFWIEIINGYHKASLLVYDIYTKNIIPLELEDKVSHYVWLDNENILCTSYSRPTICNYYIYNIHNKTKSPFCPHSLQEDGHPSVDRGTMILTDTYPDINGFQCLYLVDSIFDKKETLFKVYMKPVSNGELRTDLHPRFNSKHSKICIDTNRNGSREIIIIDNNTVMREYNN
ncbi:MAG: hypothetical protein IJA24_02280 [Alistipes sp.]|nr:hypothetical protein [Alistipes sp.]